MTVHACGDPNCQTCGAPTTRDELAPVVMSVSYPTGDGVDFFGGPKVAATAPSKPTPERRFPAAIVTLGPRPRRLF